MTARLPSFSPSRPSPPLQPPPSPSRVGARPASSTGSAVRDSASASGSTLLNGGSRAVSAQTRSGAVFGAPQHVFTAPETETLMGLGADASDRILLVTIGRHRPYQRVRVALRDTDGTLSPARTISGKGHSATQPRLSVAPDGTAVAAWAWHDSAGSRVQAAVRKPGAAFGAAQTLSAPAPKDRP